MENKFTRRAAMALGALIVSGSLAVAQPQKVYEPTEGQPGKDVIWLPTSQTLVNEMLNIAQVRPSDFLIDLGSGDGRTVISAAHRGVSALGIEYNPDMVELAKRRAEQAGVSDRAKFEKADIFESDFSKATVITMFLLPQLNMRLRPKILGLKPGTRIVSNSFDMQDWQPDETVNVENGCSYHCQAYMWIVPANVAGEWKTPDGVLKLQQKFQELTGTLTSGNVSAPISNGKVRGTKVVFSAGGRTYDLTLGNNGLEGSSSISAPFKATKAGQ